MFFSCVSWDKLLNLSVHLFGPLLNGDNNKPHPMRCDYRESIWNNVCYSKGKRRRLVKLLLLV